jgi:hypothetical protein
MKQKRNRKKAVRGKIGNGIHLEIDNLIRSPHWCTASNCAENVISIEILILCKGCPYSRPCRYTGAQSKPSGLVYSPSLSREGFVLGLEGMGKVLRVHPSP